ncbi:MAG: hypothetical protein SH857_07675 [Chitinophagales bacterium]|nr:hypothetical protein [Chitinophagales bacterium]
MDKQADMDIQVEKLNLIAWLTGINDSDVIRQLKILQRYKPKKSVIKFTKAEKAAIDKGLRSLKEGRVQSHEQVMKATAKKFPGLIK